MQLLPSIPDSVIHVAEALALGFLSYVGVKIKAAVQEVKIEQLQVKAELLDKQNEMREDMDAKHAENSKAIAVHAAEDVQKFASIQNTLQFQNTTLSRIEVKIDRNGK